MSKQYYVYLVTNRPRGVIYTGVTSSLQRRLFEHREKLVPGFASLYNASRLVYFEVTGSVQSAIAREKQIKGWLRWRKGQLIEATNPHWRDLSEEWE